MLSAMLQLRDMLVDLEVSSWIIHLVTFAGKAARRGQRQVLAAPWTLLTLSELIGRSAQERTPMDIRITDANDAPNSTLLVSARGEISVQLPHNRGKVIKKVPRLGTGRAVLRHYYRYVDRQGHAARYLNWALPASAG
jgi:hypothetical protein